MKILRRKRLTKRKGLGAIDIVPEEIAIIEIRALRKTYQYRGYRSEQ